MIVDQIRDMIENDPSSIERANKAEEVLNKYKEELIGKLVSYNGNKYDVIAWVIWVVIGNSPNDMDGINKEEEFLSRCNEFGTENVIQAILMREGIYRGAKQKSY
jgi:hypothetical protein